MKVTFISDTHGKHRLIEPDLIGGDLIIHCGDISSRGSWQECADFVLWFNNLPQYTHKVVIAGNHDFLFEKAPTSIPGLLANATNIQYLQDGSTTIDGVKIYGSPWQPEFFNWAFNLPRSGGALKARWDAIPNDVDILITHGPRYGVLDRTQEGLNVGCELLHEQFASGRIKPKVHAFGHIHEGYGMCDTDGCVSINASNLNRSYFYTNKPIHIEL